MDDERLVRGSCLCGDVRWQASGKFSLMTHCHCSMCRKAHAAPFATYVAARAANFELTAGTERIATYPASARGDRRFCSRCGSVVPENPGERHAFMPAFGLDDDPGARPLMHIFAASKAPWYTIADDLPQSAEYPEGWGSAGLARNVEPASEPGWVRGSCLCGKVAYEIEHGGHSVYHCHCSRCRKARAAAHTANLFLPSARFRWIRGQDQRTSFKVPDAERFTHVFCSTCGSGTAVDRGERAMVPAATLDGDPGIVEQRHIFVSSMPAWDTLPNDGWPRFEQSAPR
ncbi:MAG TPA: GFA family protein [Polyangiales bacterium]|nr:GFA family protein [Polyangiales bacterium]